jgi:hypothetical protein
MIHRGVIGDPEQPRIKRGLTPKTGKVPIGEDERILGDVRRIVNGPQEMRQRSEESVLVSLNQGSEQLGFASQAPIDEGLVGVHVFPALGRGAAGASSREFPSVYGFPVPGTKQRH